MRKAVTLKEVFFILLLIFLAGLILHPVLKTLRFRGKTALCVANLRAWSGILSRYSNDHDGLFPSHYSDTLGEGLNTWDIPTATKKVFDSYGAEDIWVCPVTPAGVLKEIQQNTGEKQGAVAGSDEKGFYIIPGYFYWVPRSTGQEGKFYPDKDIVTGKPFPRSISDSSAKDLPIMTDVMLKPSRVLPGNQLYLDPDFDKTAPIDTRWNRIVWDGILEGIYATHVEGNEVVNSNRLYSDSHVQTTPAAEVKTRYSATYQNLF